MSSQSQICCRHYCTDDNNSWNSLSELYLSRPLDRWEFFSIVGAMEGGWEDSRVREGEGGMEMEEGAREGGMEVGRVGGRREAGRVG